MKVKVTHRTYNLNSGIFEYSVVGFFKSYADAIRYYNGTQSWYDKSTHRFTSDGDLYIMEKY